jgi:hypothetical protein
VGLYRAALERFGEHGFPDGRGVNFIIEENVIDGNGRRGGGALNLAGLQGSLIQNNLLYGNFAHGIAQWDNQNPFDAEARTRGPGPQDPPEGAAALPIWGCHGNVIRNNTVLMASAGRAALQAIHGSWGTRAYNNVLINDEPSSFEVDAGGMYRLDARANVINTISYDGGVDALASLAVTLPAATGITRKRFAAEVRRYGEEPWVIVEGRWWRLNPERPDFHPLAGSARLSGQALGAEVPAVDLEGSPRRTADIGALSAR